MKTFLEETAETLYRKYGDNISSLRILLPSRRARLFINDALSRLAGKPLWQPVYLSIDEIMEQAAGIRKSEPLRLIAELYKVYSRYHTESFDSFYYWGEMLLSDFDSVDKYMIDARTLFVNIKDLRILESDISYFTDDQIGIIRQFWKNFNPADQSSPEKRHFANIWNTLLPVYNNLRERLTELGMAYPGMIYRVAAEKLRAHMNPAPFPQSELPSKEIEEIGRHRYAVIGFNALSATEKILFDYLKRRKTADFFWDFDTYYTDNRTQEAGLFLRENIARYPSGEMRSKPAHFSSPKIINVIAAPSDAMQAKYVHRFVREVSEKQKPDKRTAIVLTDENLLLPVAYSLPEEIEDINITMGYPLRQTPAYAFLERLIELQQRKKKTGNHTVFYHSDTLGILNHPYVQKTGGADAEKMANTIVARQMTYIPRNRFSTNPVLADIFRPVTGWENLCDYFIQTVVRIGKDQRGTDSGDMQTEYFALIADHIHKLKNSLTECGLEMSDGIMLSLLRKALQPLRVPYEGEPLKGIQVMGILETRNLDFENVIVLSVNDDTFPGNLSVSSSFIPYNLRVAYGLPTPMHHEGVYAYYFYRLLQRAQRIDLVYSGKADDKKTGEPSRYIYQLDFESPHPVNHRNIVLDIGFGKKTPPIISKTGEVKKALYEFLEGKGERRLSPSSFYSFVECPLKFYYQSIARIREEEEITEEIDLPMFGNILHKSAEIIYGGVIGDKNPKSYLKKVSHPDQLLPLVNRAVNEEYFRNESDSSDENFSGQITLVRDIVVKYLKTCLLAYDIQNPEFQVEAVETWILHEWPILMGGKEEKVRFRGKADRIDRLSNGKRRIIDYKTGGQKIEFKGIEALFSPEFAYRNAAVLQSLLYASMYPVKNGIEVEPALYFVRFMNQEDYCSRITEVMTNDEGKRLDSRQIDVVSTLAPEFKKRLRDKLEELFDETIPFTPCADTKTCDYCIYKDLCSRR